MDTEHRPARSFPPIFFSQLPLPAKAQLCSDPSQPGAETPQCPVPAAVCLCGCQCCVPGEIQSAVRTLLSRAAQTRDRPTPCLYSLILISVLFNLGSGDSPQC